MKTITAFIWILIFSPVCIFAQPIINTIAVNSTSIQKLNKFELTVGITATYSNPYNYDDIAVQCVFTAPSGRKDTVDGFFMQEYTLNNGSLTATGTGDFKVRYAPNETGTWAYSLRCTTASGTGTYAIQNFECTASTEAGFIRKNATNYLSFDNGTQYIPVGENIGWQSSNVVADYTTWLSNLTANGGNFIRVWMSSWAFGLEWKNNYNGFLGLQKYKQTSAFYFDWLLDYCKQNNVYIMTTLNNHGQVSTGVNPEWADNPYNAANGGPANNTWDFFTNATAKSLHKNRLRYIIARYGYSSTIQSWELFNEVDWTDQFDTRKADVKNWHEEMANYIKGKDVYNHLVTTSYAKDINDDATWNIANIDFSQTHYYIDAPNIENTIASGTQTYLSKFQKPILNGEFGLGPDGAALSTMDPTGIHIHNALWGTSFSGAMGSGMSWWWDSYIHPKNLYPYFKPLTTLLNGIELMKGNYKKTTATTTGGGTADASIVPGADWGIAPAASFTIDAVGGITPAATQLSRYMYGNLYNTQYRKPPTFNVTYPVAGQFKVVTGGSIGTAPKVNITVDGIEVLNTNAAINTTYSVNIAAGAHTIKVDNLGTDWFLVSNYAFTNIGSPLSTYVLKSANNAKAAGYIINYNYNWKYIQNSGGIAPPAINGAGIQLQGLQNGPCIIDFYSCSTGLLVSSYNSNISNGSVSAPLPSIGWDVAFKLSTNIYRFSGNGNWSNAANWSGNTVPPTVLPPGGEILIDPLITGECILDVPQTISSGGRIIVYANKKLLVNGNLTIQ
jgi:Domain of unknown function (DUF5060)